MRAAKLRGEPFAKCSWREEQGPLRAKTAVADSAAVIAQLAAAIAVSATTVSVATTAAVAEPAVAVTLAVTVATASPTSLPLPSPWHHRDVKRRCRPCLP